MKRTFYRFVGTLLVVPGLLMAHVGRHDHAHPHGQQHHRQLQKTFQEEVSLDWKLHNVGKVIQVVTNLGAINAATGIYDPILDYTRLLNCEFPPGSNEEHIFEGGIKIGAIINGDTLVSITNWNNAHQFFEFFPSEEPWDTVWVVQKGDTVDIPYWPGYVGVSDLDLVTRYGDYHVLTDPTHHPLYVDVIQTSYSWSSPPFDRVIVYNFYVIPRQFDLTQAYICYHLQGMVGDLLRGQLATDDDDVASYYPEHHMGVIEDLPGGVDGTAQSPVAIKIYPPENWSAPLNWTFNWYAHHHETPMTDPLMYQLQMAAHTIQSNQVQGGQSIFTIAFGPMNLAVGDTLKFTVAEILGEGVDEILRTAERLDLVKDKNFRLPSPPPRPRYQVEARNKEVVIRWEPEPGAPNPETYQDPNRADGEPVPFEGYRVYKSTQSLQGPWTLLAEYDLPGNQFGFNTGLEYEFRDVGLLNNLEYFYSVTAFSKPDTVLNFPSLESSITANARVVLPGTPPPASVGQVAVVPNPYRGDINYNAFDPKWEKNPPGRPWLEQDRRIQFINLPARCEIKIYSLAGDLIETIRHEDPEKGFEDWNLTSRVGQAIASGIYLFSVKDLENGKVQVGKFVIIK